MSAATMRTAMPVRTPMPMSAVAVTALPAMRTAAFAHVCALSMTMRVRLTLAMVLTAMTFAMTLAMVMSCAMTFAVMMSMTLAAVRMGAAMLALCVMMPLAVMRAVRLRRIFKRSCEMLRDRLIRRALDTCVDADTDLSERLDRTCADAAADQRIDIVFLQKLRERTVTAALRADDLRLFDGILLDVIELKCLRVTEVLKHRTVFIFIRDCNSHRSFSFLHGGQKTKIAGRFCTRTAFAARRGHIAKPIRAARDDERSAVYEALGDLPARRSIDLGDRRARDRHALGARLLLESVVVYAADALVFFEQQHDIVAARTACRREAFIGGAHTDSPPPRRSWHIPRLPSKVSHRVVIDICR